MNFKKPLTYALVSLSIVSVPLLSACGKEEKKEVTHSSSSSNSMKAQVNELQKTLKQLQSNLEKKDAKLTSEDGKKLNKQWLSYENNIREKYPLLYTDTEKYLLPLYSETTKDSIAWSKVQDLSASLSRSLDNLKNAKENAHQTSTELKEAVKNYKEYVNEQVNAFIGATKTFTDAVRSANMDQAKEAYGKARVFYERIEPIAESLGDLDPKIDARENDVEGKWTGFHRIEKALWKEHTLKGMTPIANQLDQDVKDLHAKIKKVKLDPATIVAGSQELLNEAALTKVTGEEERYSRIDLVDLTSNVEGSQAVYHAVLPVLTTKNKDLAKQLDTEFNKMTELLAKYKKQGAFKDYKKLSKEEVRELSNQLKTLSESMSQTAEIFQ
ncbi:hypothetical protein A374_01879 [Fictibacillus macauensis ZFHKF-1]|uniref:Imelysin-like domain-containing protein n=1 Tax=Fictibacillus macauensis ZFHKF-1 TaxID=1196324 RepID=I8UJD3_9BACL|nr:iron uptake system protein EfeO [Fictibacillus macauensis]EIT86965.1 hypothetical protein A374_01879 [Fictibacillus macauensis ZFHKF-1]